MCPEILGVAVGDAHIDGYIAVFLRGLSDGLPHHRQVVGMEMGGNAHLGAVILGDGCVAEMLLPLGGAVHGVVCHVPLKDDAVGHLDNGAVALNVLFIAAIVGLDTGMIRQCVVEEDLPILLQIAAALIQHPPHRAILALEAIFDLAAGEVLLQS